MKPSPSAQSVTPGPLGMDVGNDEILRTERADRGERIAEVCPRIPGRFTYTCSGRCAGCRESRKSADQDTTKYAAVY